MANSWDFSLYWLCRKPLPGLSIPIGSLFRVNKTWLDNMLLRANPHSTSNRPASTTDESDRRLELQDIHTGVVIELWACFMADDFESWRPSEILIPEWNTGIIEFQGVEELAYWDYKDQGLING